MNQLTDHEIIDQFIHELDMRGFDLWRLKEARDILEQGKHYCPKCSDEVKEDDDAMCANCVR